MHKTSSRRTGTIYGKIYHVHITPTNILLFRTIHVHIIILLCQQQNSSSNKHNVLKLESHCQYANACT